MRCSSTPGATPRSTPRSACAGLPGQARSKGIVAAERVTRLKVTEIFHSLQGEADTAGWPTVFVRLTGCPLRCQYCDTTYAFHGGEWRTFDEIETEVRRHATPYVCVTGGE